MSHIIDISWPISPSMTSYKNSKPVIITQTRTLETGGMRETNISCNSHSGTHVDAPSHKLADGKTIDQIPLENLIGPAVVLDLTHIDNAITDEDLKSYTLDQGDIVLLKTKNSALADDAPFFSEFVYLAASGAALLAYMGVKAVGIDYLGIERNSPAHETHTTLLSKNIPIIEGLRLALTAPGRYQLYCLPLASLGIEAAPARAILMKI